MRLDGTSNHPRWKGDQASYGAFHRRVARVRGKPAACEKCGLADPARRYEWANLTGDYPNPMDYERMCVPCHRAFDRAKETPGSRRLRADNSTGITGVEYHPQLKRPWRAVIRRGNRRIHLGLFATKEDAAEARLRAELENV